MADEAKPNVGSASVEVVPDARGFKKKLEADLADVVVEIKAKLKTELIRAQLDELSKTSIVGIKAKLDEIDAAKVEGEVDALTRAREVKVKVKAEGLRQLEKDLGSISDKLKNAPSGGLFGWIAGLAPALIPFGGAAVGLLGGIASGATEAAGAVGVLAIAMKSLTGGTTAYQAYQSQVGSANANYQTALAAASLKSGAPTKKGGPSAQATAIAAANAAHAKALGTAQRSLDNSAYGKLSDAGQQYVAYNVGTFSPFKTQLSQATTNGVAPGLTALEKAVVADGPQIKAAIGDISSAVGNLMTEAGHALQSPFWRQWLVWFGKDSARNVGTMGHSVGELVEALARMDQRAGGAGKIVDDVDRLATRLNNWSGSSKFDMFLQHLRTDEAETSQFLKALWTDLDPILKGVSATGGGELQLLTGSLSLISHLPTGWLEEAGRWLPIIFLSLKLANGPLAAVGMGFAGVTKSMAKMAEEGASKMDIFKANIQGAMKGAAGVAGIGLLIDSATRASGTMDTLEMSAAGAALGLSMGGPFGALIGGAVGGLAGLTKSLFESGNAANINYAAIGKAQAMKDAQSGADALAASLDQVTGAYGAATRAAVLNQLQSTASGRAELAYLAKHGVTTTQAVSAVMGDPNAAKQANAALGTLPKGLSSAQANVSSLQSALDRGYNNGGRVTPLNGEDASLKAMGLKATNGTYSEADVKNALRYQGDLVKTYTELQSTLGDVTKTLATQQRQTRENAIATGDLSVKLLQTSDQLKSWPKELLTKVSAVGTAQTMQGLLGIVDAAHKMGMKNLSSGQAFAEATILVKADPDIAHTKQSILDVANALMGIKSPPPVSITADTSQAKNAIAALFPTAPGLAALGISITPPKPKPTSKPRPGKAIGGAVYAGITYDVGENGRETFTPRVDGNIRSNQQIRSVRGGDVVRLHRDDIAAIAAVVQGGVHFGVQNELAFPGGS